MLISCPECNHSVSDRAISCPSCGFPINIISKTKNTALNRNPRRRRKLPNGSGCIKQLSGKRSKPWAAYPPVTQFALNGSPVSVPAIGYYKTYNAAYAALLEYNTNPFDLANRNITFAEMYELYFTEKYNNSKRKLSSASQYSTKAAFKNCAILHDRKFLDLRKADLQNVVDNCTLKHSSLELIVSLFKGMYTYAIQNDYTDKDYAQFVTINIPDDDESGVPFSQEAINLLWEHRDDNENIGMILVMIYTGFRISAFKTIQINLEDDYLQGGVKTTMSKNRIVPIHPSIKPYVVQFKEQYITDGKNKFSVQKFRSIFSEQLELLGLSVSSKNTKHTPHDCRHTFSWLCDKYKVDEISKHMLMGHVLGNDVESNVYGHRTTDELRDAINKIKIPE